MKLLIDSTTKDLGPWIEALRKELSNENVVTWGESWDPDSISTAVVWNHRAELFKRIPKVKLVASLGAGVDHIMSDPYLPPKAQITRVISQHLSTPMSNYCIGAILYFRKQFDKYLLDKGSKIWDPEFDPERDLKIGILGMGELGQDLASKLVPLEFDINGMSQSPKKIPGVKSYVLSQWDEFLQSINLLVCMLPATPETKGILNRDLFRKMGKGSFLINVARGQHQIDEDILWALDKGFLDGAFLDVFPNEPLPSNSPLWNHPNVFITPHIAVVTKLEAAIPTIVENHKRVQEGRPIIGLADRKKGY